MSNWTIFWLTLGVIAGTGEGIALYRTAPGDTLSEQIWHWLKVTPGKTPLPGVLISWRSFALGGFLVWLIGHFLFGWWT